ncbi:photosystem reaction center subunit H [Lewinellaceae bacterium SD302]|nr:photosystem reaction center subunit H [Lewinellaceae bacterium SD302]
MNTRLLSSSSITGTTVYNTRNEKLGEIKDLMINVHNGHINYAVLSFGGFLGLGDKYFAVPMEAFTINRDNENFVLNVSKDRLENAPGFDKDNWPSSTDETYTNDVYRYYDLERSRVVKPEMVS